MAVAVGRLPYLAGAGRTLSDTAERLVGSGGGHLISHAPTAGASRPLVLGLSALLALAAVPCAPAVRIIFTS